MDLKLSMKTADYCPFHLFTEMEAQRFSQGAQWSEPEVQRPGLLKPKLFRWFTVRLVRPESGLVRNPSALNSPGPFGALGLANQDGHSKLHDIVRKDLCRHDWNSRATTELQWTALRSV